MGFLLNLKKENINDNIFIKNNIYGLIFLSSVLLLEFQFKSMRFNNLVDLLALGLIFLIVSIYLNTRKLYSNNFLKFLSIGICFIFLLKLTFIVLSFQLNGQIQFRFFKYISITYIRSIFIVLSFRYINKEFNNKNIICVCSLLLLILLISILYFCICTRIQNKNIININTCILLILNIGLLKITYINKHRLDKVTYKCIIAVIVLSILSILFTLSLVFSSEFKKIFYILEYSFDLFIYFCLYKCILNGSISKITENFKDNCKYDNNNYLKRLESVMIKIDKTNKTFYEDFFDKLDIPLILVKEDYIVFSNNAACEIMGVDGKIKYKYISRYWKKYKQINEEEYLKNTEKEKIELKDEIIELEDNRKIKANISLFNVNMFDDKYLCISIKNETVSAYDFKKLKEDNNIIKSRDRRRTEFFANLSHDFRTPINVIYTAIQVMDIGVKNKNINAIKKYTKIMKQNCYRLLRLINNLIDATKIDAGYYDLNLENNDIVSLIEDIVTSVSGYVQHNNMNIIFDTDVEEKILACDKDLIERAFLNLISNAIKYKKEGRGEIFVNINTDREMVSISVKDKGMGIPKEKQRIIFERFVQANASLDKNCNSSGIGLSLVKSIADMHKGSVDLKSEEGVGSEFIIRLPIKIVENDKGKKSEMNVKSKKEKINIEFSDVYTIK